MDRLDPDEDLAKRVLAAIRLGDLEELRRVAGGAGERRERAGRAAEWIRATGPHRWVGIYDVLPGVGKVVAVAWNGPSAPAHPEFPLTTGLTGRAIAEQRTVNVGDVASDPRYLVALGDTRSEIIVPVFAEGSRRVIGTLDVESERKDAFAPATQELLERCAEAIRGLWSATAGRDRAA
jgi:putative methionine-R-sulfoxide reductase with GAF domain